MSVPRLRPDGFKVLAQEPRMRALHCKKADAVTPTSHPQRQVAVSGYWGGASWAPGEQLKLGMQVRAVRAKRLRAASGCPFREFANAPISVDCPV